MPSASIRPSQALPLGPRSGSARTRKGLYPLDPSRARPDARSGQHRPMLHSSVAGVCDTSSLLVRTLARPPKDPRASLNRRWARSNSRDGELYVFRLRPIDRSSRDGPAGPSPTRLRREVRSLSRLAKSHCFLQCHRVRIVTALYSFFVRATPNARTGSFFVG